MDIRQINSVSKGEIKQITKIHLGALGDSFINKFGEEFLSSLYQFVIENDNNIVIILKKRNKIIGFIVATKQSNSFVKKVVIDCFLKSPLKTLQIIASRPLLAMRAAMWQFIDKKPPSKPELQFIAIDKKFRGKGFGSRLIDKLVIEFSHIGIFEFMVGTKRNNALSNGFWKKMGYKYIGQYSAFGQPLNYYLARYLKKKEFLSPRN